MNTATVLLFGLLIFIYGSGVTLLVHDWIKDGRQTVIKDLKETFKY